MRNTWLLLKIQLSALLGFNKIIHLKDKRERRRKLAGRIALGICMLMLLPAFGSYGFLMAMGMNELGQIGLFPGVMLAATSVLTLVSSVSLANGTFFAFRDYELIVSLPVKHTEIALSRMLLGYATGSLFDFLVMLPCGAAYAYFARPAASFYPIFLVTMLAAPVLPMLAGGLIGAVVARLAASIRGAKYFQMLGATALTLGIMALSMNMEAIVESGIFGDIGVLISNAMNRIYPLTGLYVSAVRDLNWLAALAFTAIAPAGLWLAALLLGRYLRGVNAALTASRAAGRYRMKALNTSSPLVALYKKELRRYLSSTVYLFNTAFGLVLSLVGVAMLAVKGRDIIRMALLAMELTGVDDRMIVYGIGYIGAFMVITCCTTCCSISLEGRRLWIIQSLPVQGFDVLMSKLLVNLTLSVPTSLLIGLGAGLALRMSAAETALITAVGLGYSLMSASLGLFVNLKNHNFEWTTDAVVVKQSAATGISMAVNMILVALPAVLTFVFYDHAWLICWTAAGLSAAVGAALVCAFRVHGDRWIRQL